MTDKQNTMRPDNLAWVAGSDAPESWRDYLYWNVELEDT